MSLLEAKKKCRDLLLLFLPVIERAEWLEFNASK